MFVGIQGRNKMSTNSEFNIITGSKKFTVSDSMYYQFTEIASNR